MTDRYVELHAASAFSFLEGARNRNILQRAVELEMPAMALMDRNGVYGSARFHTSAKECGLRAHVGAEIAVTGLGNALRHLRGFPISTLLNQRMYPFFANPVQGYQNLCQLITHFKIARADKRRRAALLGDLEASTASGLVCLTGGDEGPLAAALMNGGEEAGREVVEQACSRSLDGKNVYVELQRHSEREEEWRNQAAIRIAESLQLPVLATNGVRYATAYDREILDLFTAIRNHTELDHAGRLLALNNQRHLRPAREMVALFRDVPGAVDNTVELSSRLNLSSTIWATSFLATRCLTAKRWTAFFASASPKASCSVMGRKMIATFWNARRSKWNMNSR